MSESNARTSPGRTGGRSGMSRKPVMVAELINYATAPAAREARLSVAIGAPTTRPLPALGFHIGRVTAASDRTVERIRSLGPAHLRVDALLRNDGWEHDLPAASELARRVGCGIELGVRWDGSIDHGALSDLADSVTGNGILRRMLALGSGTAIPSRADQQVLREVARARFPGAAVFASAGADFGVLNRGWDEIVGADGVSYAIQAQVHASDDLSVIESLDGQASTVETAIAKGGGLPVGVSSVAMGPGGPNDAPDPRQPSLFGAGWTVGSIASLADAGAQSVTYLGIAGVDQLAVGPDEDGHGDVDGDAVHPSYHVFADLAEVRSGRRLETVTAGDLPSAVFGVVSTGGIRLLVANLSNCPVRAEVAGLGDGPGELRVLDASSATLACLSPERFRSASSRVATIDGQLTVGLAPFAVATISQRASLATPRAKGVAGWVSTSGSHPSGPAPSRPGSRASRMRPRQPHRRAVSAETWVSTGAATRMLKPTRAIPLDRPGQ